MRRARREYRAARTHSRHPGEPGRRLKGGFEPTLIIEDTAREGARTLREKADQAIGIGRFFGSACQLAKSASFALAVLRWRRIEAEVLGDELRGREHIAISSEPLRKRARAIR